jgi:hypothetical protein
VFAKVNVQPRLCKHAYLPKIITYPQNDWSIYYVEFPASAVLTQTGQELVWGRNNGLYLKEEKANILGRTGFLSQNDLPFIATSTAFAMLSGFVLVFLLPYNPLLAWTLFILLETVICLLIYSRLRRARRISRRTIPHNDRDLRSVRRILSSEILFPVTAWYGVK